MKTLSRVCPICACREGEALTTISLAPVQNEALPPTFDICVCKECKFCFDDLQAKQEDFDRFYADSAKYATANTGGSGGSSAADIKRWSHVLDILAPHIRSSHRIVDVGCGKGGLLMALRSRGFQNLVGIEPSLRCRQSLAEQNIPCYPTVKEAICEEGEPFDCVLCCQVLEHVFALDDFLADIGNLLKHDGTLYVEVPDAAGYADFFHAPFYYFDREHINHFTLDSLDNLILKHLAYRPIFGKRGSAHPVEGKETPVLWAVYKPSLHGAKTLKPDENGSHTVNTYVRLSTERDFFYPQLDAVRENRAHVLLWGCGAHLRRLLAKGCFSGIRLAGIIDRDRGGRGESLSGLPILPPQSILEPEFKDFTVIITTVLYADHVRSFLAEQMFEGEVILMSD
jgi:SAM-dependent methyltransferase